MNRRKRSLFARRRSFLIAALAALTVGTAVAATPAATVAPAAKAAPVASVSIHADNPATAPATVRKQSQEKKIVLNLASRMLTLYEGKVKIRMYPVGVGKYATPTPIGYYSVQVKEVNPTWIDPDSRTEIESGPTNPLGYRWMGIHGNYGIHGTNRPESIGGYVSNGCIRLLEKDIEDLYDHTPVGTPVEIFYDRIVIDSAPDHTVSYYIYPDGYERQPLEVEAVKKALAGYGVDNFESAEAIQAKIAASDGKPTYVAKAYDLLVNGRKLPLRALGKNGKVYLPAVAVATALRANLTWNAAEKMLTGPYAAVPGSVHSDVVYVEAADAKCMFHLDGGLTPELTYSLMLIKEAVSPAPAAGQEAGKVRDKMPVKETVKAPVNDTVKEKTKRIDLKEKIQQKGAEKA